MKFDIVLATHGKMSDGLADAAQVIIGQTDQLYTLNLEPGMDVDSLGDALEERFNQGTGDGQGVLVLVDLLSASPFNQSVLATSRLSPEQQQQVYVIGGVNLPLVIEAINQQMLGTSLEDAMETLLASANAGIGSWHVTDLLEADDDDGF